MVAGLRVMAVVGARPKQGQDLAVALGVRLASPPAVWLQGAVLRAHRRRDGSGVEEPWQACQPAELQA